MKKEELAAIGLTDEQTEKVFALNGKDIEAAKAKFQDYDGLKTQLQEANKTIESFKALDIESIRAAANEWKQKYEQAEKDHVAQLADMEFSRLLSDAIASAKGRNQKAIQALLDIETLKASKNQETDVKHALETLKKDSGYLFEESVTPPPYAPGTGNDQVPMSRYDKEAFQKMGYRERLELKQQHPKIYEQLKE